MFNWRDVRSTADLNTFLDDYNELSEADKENIDIEMALLIAARKDLEHEKRYGQVKPRQVEEKKPLRKPRRRYRR